ncbi:hypothetical protein GCM10009030_06220 [Haloarcula pellucida]|uniref:Halobacterial output domain-containing protein n=1 Tax=Haloarcula pellucida TaxID=1427151 RepID=A0A830GHW9_9EURY|nr:hypothetical protein GCM10009030_06220 [Halomicroarcula pellucida]
MSHPTRHRTTPSEPNGQPSLHPIIDAPSVVVFDESTRRELYEKWLADTISVHTPTSCAEAKEAISETTTVAIVRHELSTELRERLATLLWRLAPQSRVVFATSSHLPVYNTTPTAQVHLSEPIDREQLRDAVLGQARIAVYSVALSEYYRRTTQLAGMRLDSTVSDDVRDEIEATAEALSSVVDGLGAKLTADERREVLDLLVDEAAGEPVESAVTGSKYRPEACTECDDSRTGQDAFRDLGAYVWECKSCGTVYERSAAANRRVAKR